jgi:threonine/homoserine/homoserine lactone efflux protein
VLPQFTRVEQGWPPALRLATLGAIYMTVCALFYVPLAYTANRVLGTRPRLAQVTTRFAGVAMVVVGPPSSPNACTTS